MDYNKVSGLLKRISELEAQNTALIAENERLRKAFGLPVEEIIKQTIPEEKKIMKYR
jgi:regulator of replication initiation timing